MPQISKSCRWTKIQTRNIGDVLRYGNAVNICIVYTHIIVHTFNISMQKSYFSQLIKNWMIIHPTQENGWQMNFGAKKTRRADEHSVFVCFRDVHICE